jgi:IclR family transcriptional regulator, acetate operon repressor
MGEARDRAGAPAVGYQTRSVERALAILDVFSDDRAQVTLKDLHEILELPKPTISRLASMLDRKGYLRRNGAHYELGPKTFELGAMYVRQRRVVDRCRGPLKTLALATRQTASLAEIAGAGIVHLLVVPSPMPVQHVTETGSRAPAHATALGKVLLAALEPDEVDAQLGPGPYERFTENTITGREALFEELNRVRRQGYAVDNEEFAPGLKCVSIAIELDHLGLTSVSASGPTADFSNTAVRAIVKELRAAAFALHAAVSGDDGAEPGMLLQSA